MEKFDIDREIARYAERICGDIRNRRVRRSTTEEYIHHMEDATDRYMRQGMMPEEAVAAACRDLGDPFEMMTLLAVAHNGDPLPRRCWFALGIVGLLSLYVAWQFAADTWMRGWLGWTVGILAVLLGCMVVGMLYRWGRALLIRLRARGQLIACTQRCGFTLTQSKNSVLTLFKRSRVPEWVVDTPDTRYIINLMPAVRRLRILCFYPTGIYTYIRRDWFSILFAYGRFSSGFMGPQGARECEKTAGIYRTPEIDYEAYDRKGKRNVHILLVNPVSMEVRLSDGHSIRPMSDGDRLPTAYQNAFLYTASGLIRCIESSAE